MHFFKSMTIRLAILMLCLGLPALGQTPRMVDNPPSVPMALPVAPITYHLEWTVNNGFPPDHLFPTYIYHAYSVSGLWTLWGVSFTNNCLLPTVSAQEYFRVY